MTDRGFHFASRTISAGTLRAILAVVVIALYGLWVLPDDVRRVPRPITAAQNPNVAEGAAWWQGHIDLPQPIGEIATVDGRHVNIYPPLVSILAASLHPFTPGRIPAWWSALLLGIVLPLLALATFSRASKSIGWGAGLTAVYLFGSPLLPVVIHVFRGGLVYHVNQAYAQIGLMLLLFELCGRQRAWVMGAGLIAGTWARQLILLYAPLVLLAAWFEPRKDLERHRPRRGRALLAATLSVAVALGGLMVMNALRFGNPLQSGYGYVADQHRSDFGPAIDPEAIGPFSLRYVPRNLYYMHVAPPHAAWLNGRLIYDGNNYGTSIWLTMPILFVLFIDLGRIFHDRLRLTLLLTALAIMAVQMTYFNTGYAQRGYSRFALDFLPALLVLIAPCVGTGLRRFITPVLAAWSLLYFGWLTNQ